MKLTCKVRICATDCRVGSASATARPKQTTLVLCVRQRATDASGGSESFYSLKFVCVGDKQQRLVQLGAGCLTQCLRQNSARGLATISLRSLPRQFVFISEADPKALAHLLDLLTQISAGERPNIEEHESAKVTPPPPARLTIETREKYERAEFTLHLQALTLSGLGLRRIERRLLEARNLRVLDLSANSLGGDNTHDLNRILTVALRSRWTKLESLSLNGNNIRFLARSTLDALPANLVELNVSRNPLPSLPLSLGRVPARLRYLNLDGTRLRALPPELATECPALERICCAENEMLALPGWVAARSKVPRSSFAISAQSLRMAVFAALLRQDSAWTATDLLDDEPIALNGFSYTFSGLDEDDKLFAELFVRTPTAERLCAQTGLSSADLDVLCRARHSTDVELEIPDERVATGQLRIADRRKNNCGGGGDLPALGNRRRVAPPLQALAYQTFVNCERARRQHDALPAATKELIGEIRSRLGDALQVCTRCSRLCAPASSRLAVAPFSSWFRDPTGQLQDSMSTVVWHEVFCAPCARLRRSRNSDRGGGGGGGEHQTVVRVE